MDIEDKTTAPETTATEPTQAPAPTEIRNPDAVLKALESERAARKELEKKVKAFEGIDPAKYQEYTAAEQKRAEEKELQERKRLEEKGAYEALTAKQREEHQREIKAIQDQLEALKAEREAIVTQAKEKDTAIARMKLETKAQKAFLAENGEPDDWSDFVWDKMSKHIISTEDGGIQIIKDNGNLWTDAKGNPLDMRGLFANFREGRGAKFFKPSNAGEGGGFVPQKGQPAAAKTISRDDLSNPSAMRKAGVTLADISSGKVKVI